MKLKYPKSQGFTKGDVLKEKKQFRFAEAWVYSSNKKMHYLTLNPSKVKKMCLKKKR